MKLELARLGRDGACGFDYVMGILPVALVHSLARMTRNARHGGKKEEKSRGGEEVKKISELESENEANLNE